MSRKEQDYSHLLTEKNKDLYRYAPSEAIAICRELFVHHHVSLLAACEHIGIPKTTAYRYRPRWQKVRSALFEEKVGATEKDRAAVFKDADVRELEDIAAVSRKLLLREMESLDESGTSLTPAEIRMVKEVHDSVVKGIALLSKVSAPLGVKGEAGEGEVSINDVDPATFNSELQKLLKQNEKKPEREAGSGDSSEDSGD